MGFMLEEIPEGLNNPEKVECIECGRTILLIGAYELQNPCDKGKYVCAKQCLVEYLDRVD